MFKKLPTEEHELLRKLVDSNGDYEKGGFDTGSKIGIRVTYWSDELKLIFRLIDRGFLLNDGQGDFLQLTPRAFDYVNFDFEMENENMRQNGNRIFIQGSAHGAQFQQGTTNSMQTISNTASINYDEVLKLLIDIKEASHDANFKEDAGKNVDDFKELISEAIEMVEKKEDSSKIKNSLFKLKDMAEKVLISMVASGISTQITQLLQGI